MNRYAVTANVLHIHHLRQGAERGCTCETVETLPTFIIEGSYNLHIAHAIALDILGKDRIYYPSLTVVKI